MRVSEPYVFVRVQAQELHVLHKPAKPEVCVLPRSVTRHRQPSHLHPSRRQPEDAATFHVPLTKVCRAAKGKKGSENSGNAAQFDIAS